MAYRDPYGNNAAGQGYAQGYGQSHNQTDPTFYNPYADYQSPAPQAQASYGHDDHSGAGVGASNGANANANSSYMDDPFVPPSQAPYGANSNNNNAAMSGGNERTSTYEKAGGFVSTPVRANKSAAAVKAWRYEHQGNLWKKGGKGRSVGRFCCCFLFSFLFILITLVLSLALFIRPPNIVINGVIPPTNGSQVQVTQDPALQVNLNVNISVSNPNYFDVSFKSIDLDINYPIKNTPFGGGHSQNIVFKSDSQQEWDFPFAILYKFADDPDKTILKDLLKKCGPGGSGKLTINYKLKLGLRILAVTVNPAVNNKFDFKCPDITSKLTEFAKLVGVDINDVLNA